MPSIIPGYEYDIFISYRQKDNKRDGWVTEFIDTLKDEIEATFKEDISIYFDENPHDGLHEHHEVDDSLREKLKCLIFIPIVSQTYCDPKCFAWEHEFKVFLDQAGNDQFGLKTKLSGGNVASRVLPVKIHTLDSEDEQLFESEVGGVMRSIDFIYSETGVNRPLKPIDHEDKNLNKTNYRNQINKVANAIKGIISGIKSEEFIEDKSTSTSTFESKSIDTKPKSKSKILMASISILLVLALAYLFYSNQNKSEVIDEEIDKSIAVLPFVNMSNDQEQEYFSDGLSEELLNLLAKIPELKVIGRTSSFSFKGKNEDLRTIGQKLGVSYLLEGSVRKSGDDIRITAQLILAEDGSHLWSETYDRQMIDVFAVQDEIASEVVDQLKLSIPGLAITPVSKNVEAYNLFLEANYIRQQRLPGHQEKRIQLMEQAIALDSTDARFWAGLADSYLFWEGSHTLRAERAAKAREFAERAIALEETNATGHFVLGRILHQFYWEWENAEKEFKRAEELSPEFAGATASTFGTFAKWDQAIAASKKRIDGDPVNPVRWRGLGHQYIQAGKYEEAISPLKKALELSPNYSTAWLEMGWAYQYLGQYKQAWEMYNHVDKESIRFQYHLFSIYYDMGNISESNLYLEKMFEMDGEIDMSLHLASAFAKRGEADKCFRWLNIAYERKHPALSLIKGGDDSNFVGALQDPRYEEFLKKMNLPID